MHSDVGSDMISLDGGGSTRTPLTLQVEIVGALSANMAFADMFLISFRIVD